MIKVLLFSYLKDQVGQEVLELQQEEMTVKEIKEYILSNYEVEQLESVMIAVNEEYATDVTVAKSGDSVALIPPVSGG